MCDSEEVDEICEQRGLCIGVVQRSVQARARGRSTWAACSSTGVQGVHRKYTVHIVEGFFGDLWQQADVVNGFQI